MKNYYLTLEIKQMQFSQVIGHDKEKQKLIELVEANRLPHAILFSNKKGNGGFALAQALGQYLLCDNKKENGACGECNACKTAAKLIHPDLHLSFPIFNKSKDSTNPSTCKDFIEEFRRFIIERPYADARAWIQSLTKENKQGNIPAKECNEISRKLMLRPLLGGAKVLIIWYAEFLGDAGNKLLKLIEEPPKHTYIFFIAENPDRILQTIQSRAQLFALKPYSFKTIEEALIAQGLSKETAKEKALLANGNADDALRNKNEDDINYYEYLRQWLNAIYTNNIVAFHTICMRIDALPKEQGKGFFQYVHQILAFVNRLSFESAEKLPLGNKEKNLIKGLHKQGLDAYSIEICNQLIEDCIYHLERNVYKRLLIYSTSLKVQEALLRKKTTA